MWIKMSMDQIKAGGIYLKGQTLDLPESIIEQFDEGSYEQTTAPWDKNVPPEQLRLRAAEASYKAIKGRADQLQLQIESTKKTLSDLEVKLSLAVEDLDKASKELDLAKKAVKKEREKAARNAADPKAAEKAAGPKAAEPEQKEGPESKDEKGKSEEKSDTKPKRQPPQKR